MIGFSELYHSYLQYKDRPFVIGIAGSAGLGKSTYCINLKDFFLSKGVLATYFPLDGFLLSRKERSDNGLCGYNPSASNLNKIAFTINEILENKKVQLPVYNHDTGTIEHAVSISNGEVIIIDGNMSIIPRINNTFVSYQVFFDSSNEIKKNLRLVVDYEERGYSFQQAEKIYQLEQNDFNTYIECQKNNSNLIIFVNSDRTLTLLA